MHTEANRFSREISAFYDSYFKSEKLATSYIELILIVEEAGDVTQKEIADKLSLAPSTITRFINKLEKRGLVSKKMDGRMARIVLTNRGAQQAPELREKYHQAESDLQKLLGDKFVDTTRQLLDHGSEIMARP